MCERYKLNGGESPEENNALFECFRDQSDAYQTSGECVIFVVLGLLRLFRVFLPSDVSLHPSLAIPLQTRKPVVLRCQLLPR